MSAQRSRRRGVGVWPASRRRPGQPAGAGAPVCLPAPAGRIGSVGWLWGGVGPQTRARRGDGVWDVLLVSEAGLSRPVFGRRGRAGSVCVRRQPVRRVPEAPGPARNSPAGCRCVRHCAVGLCGPRTAAATGFLRPAGRAPASRARQTRTVTSRCHRSRGRRQHAGAGAGPSAASSSGPLRRADSTAEVSRRARPVRSGQGRFKPGRAESFV